MGAFLFRVRHICHVRDGAHQWIFCHRLHLKFWAFESVYIWSISKGVWSWRHSPCLQSHRPPCDSLAPSSVISSCPSSGQFLPCRNGFLMTHALNSLKWWIKLRQRVHSFIERKYIDSSASWIENLRRLPRLCLEGNHTSVMSSCPSWCS